jgi:hypothetical protein
VAGSTGHFYGMPTPGQVIDARVSRIGQMDEKPVSRSLSVRHTVACEAVYVERLDSNRRFLDNPPKGF